MSFQWDMENSQPPPDPGRWDIWLSILIVFRFFGILILMLWLILR